MTDNWPKKKECVENGCPGKTSLEWPSQITSSSTIIDNTLDTTIWFHNSLNINPFPVYGNLIVSSSGGFANLLISGGDQSGNLVLPCCQCQIPLTVTPNIMLNGSIAKNVSNAILTRRGGHTSSCFTVLDSDLVNTSYQIDIQYHYSSIDGNVTADIYNLDLHKI
jgi:hypothetical protein